MEADAPRPSLTLRWGPNRPRAVAKFRDPEPLLEQTSTKRKNFTPTITKQQTTKDQPPYQLQCGDKVYNGTPEVGLMNNASKSTGSSYVVCSYDPDANSLLLSPVDQWIACRPGINYPTLDLEQAELALERKDIRGATLDRRFSALQAKGNISDENADEDLEEAFEDIPDIEDGREGLDMEADEMEEADDDDFAFEDDEQAVSARVEASKLEEARAARLVAFGEVENDGEEGEDEDGDFGTSTRARFRDQKRALKEAKRQMGRSADDVDDDDDDDDFEADQSRELLRQILGGTQGDEQTANKAEKSKAAKVKGPDNAKDAQVGRNTDKPPISPLLGKRKTSEEATTSEDSAKRSRGSAAEVASAPAPTVARRRVTEREVVMLLHENGNMPTKVLTTHFKAFMHSQEERDYLKKIITKVAKIVKQGTGNVVTLTEETILNYKLNTG